MEAEVSYHDFDLEFKEPAGTSRGVYRTRHVWYVRIQTPDGRFGLGECAPLPDLSCDAEADPKVYEQHLRKALQELGQWYRLQEQRSQAENKEALTLLFESLRNYPSILMGVETALYHHARNSWAIWGNTPFAEGKAGIPINGLIWMGTFEEMYKRIHEKMEAGFRCIKLKIGAIDFEKELALLQFIRLHFSASDLELRVDANGAFPVELAPERLQRLAEFELHSIEQPIRQGQWEAMARLCETTPLPIALDEELIGINNPTEKARLLDAIHPQYLILKPSLHGSFWGTSEWIRLAEARSLGWWITSALESNVGLNAIAQYCALLKVSVPQGLGTGQLFTNNIPSPLRIKGDELWFNGK